MYFLCICLYVHVCNERKMTIFQIITWWWLNLESDSKFTSDDVILASLYTKYVNRPQSHIWSCGLIAFKESLWLCGIKMWIRDMLWYKDDYIILYIIVPEICNCRLSSYIYTFVICPCGWLFTYRSTYYLF